MNGRLSKVDMTARLLKLKHDIDTKMYQPKWTSIERWSAQQALNSALDILDEYHY
jgi:hypothetical protein